MNLRNLNLVELNAQEVQEVDGGYPIIWWLVGGLAYDIASNWNDSKAAFMEGYNR
jgi:hypothetical protein